MKQFTIEIGNSERTVTINTLAQRNYADHFGIKYVNDTISSLAVEIRDENGLNVAAMTYELMDRYAWLLYFGIAESCRRENIPCSVTAEDCLEIFDSYEKMQIVMLNMFGTLPSPEKDNLEGEQTGNVQSPEKNPG